MDNDYPPTLIPQEPILEQNATTKPTEASSKVGAFFWDILETVVFALAIFVIVYLFIAQPHQVQGSSMYPNFTNGEYILTNKLIYRLENPQRGDVIVFQSPTDKDFIKRVIGLPGETFKVENGKLYINGTQLKEEYLPENLYTQDGADFQNGEDIKIPNDSYVVLGDNRNASSDSRDWGFRTKKDIIGKAWVIYWPLNRFGLVPHARYDN